MLFAPTLLHSKQLSRAFVEFMIADRGQFEPGHAQRLDRRLIEEQRRTDRAGADQVSRGDGDAVRRADLLKRACQIGRAARRDGSIGGRNGEVQRLEIAVEVVDSEDLHLYRAGGLGDRRWRCRAGSDKSQKREGKDAFHSRSNSKLVIPA